MGSSRNKRPILTYKLPELFSEWTEGNIPAENSEKVDYSVYTYLRPKGREPVSYSFNNSTSQQRDTGFNHKLSCLWLHAVKQLMDEAEFEDDEVIQSGSPVEYVFIITEKGYNYKFLVSKFPVMACSQGPGVFVSLRNVTFFADTLNQTGSRKVLFSLVSEKMSDVFFVVDTSGSLTFLSASVKNLSGYSPEEIEQLPLRIIFGEDGENKIVNVWQNFTQKLKAGESISEFQPETLELEFLRKDGISRWAEVTLTTFAADGSQISGMYGLIHDITSRVISHEAIRQSLAYEMKLSDVKSKYISSISHEFRTPLSIIYSNLQLLESHQAELDAETVTEAYELSRMAVKTLLRVLDKVTVIDSIKKGRIEFRPALTNLPELCNKLVKELNELEMYPNRVEISFDDFSEKVSIDETLFSHIFTNLLLNALKFSDTKLKIQVEVKKPAPDRVAIVIKDQGIGIPEDELNFIFESFYRASNAKNSRGSGLGLAVVRDCLSLHKGEIYIESKVGAGTTVTATFPLTFQEELSN